MQLYKVTFNDIGMKINLKTWKFSITVTCKVGQTNYWKKIPKVPINTETVILQLRLNKSCMETNWLGRKKSDNTSSFKKTISFGQLTTAKRLLKNKQVLASYFHIFVLFGCVNHDVEQYSTNNKTKYSICCTYWFIYKIIHNYQIILGQ